MPVDDHFRHGFVEHRGAHDLIAQTTIVTERVQHVLHVIPRPHDDRSRGVAPDGALMTQPPTPHPSRPKERDETRWQRCVQLSANADPLEQHEDHGEDAEREARRMRDALVLGDPCAHDRRLARVEEAEHREPDSCCGQGNAREDPRIVGEEVRRGRQQREYGGGGAREHHHDGVAGTQESSVTSLPLLTTDQRCGSARCDGLSSCDQRTDPWQLKRGRGLFDRTHRSTPWTTSNDRILPPAVRVQPQSPKRLCFPQRTLKSPRIARRPQTFRAAFKSHDSAGRQLARARGVSFS